LVLIVIAFTAGVLAPAWNEYERNTERVLKFRDQIDRYAQLGRQQSQLQRQIKRLKQQSKNNKRQFVEGAAPALAAAALQQRLRDLMERNGGRLISTQTLNVKDNEAFPMVSVKAHISAPIEAIRDLLYSLETGQPHLVVDNLLIQAKRSSRQRRSSRIRGAPVQTSLDVQFILSGYVNGFDT